MFTNLSQPDDDRAVVLRLAVPDARAELVADELFRAGATSIEERPGELVAGFGNRAAARRALAALGGPDQQGALVEVPDDTWFDGWRAFARPNRAGHRLVVRPTWVPYEALPGDVVVDIDPGRTFGSGAHPTTRLVLARLEAAVERGARRLLDVGSGSGVLAVAGGLLGATTIVAVDVDASARQATAANLARNHVAGEVRDRLPEGHFDVAVANIGARTLIELAGSLQARSDCVVCAGFFLDDADAVRAAYDRATRVVVDEEAGWACLTFTFS